MNVPLLNLPRQYKAIKKDIDKAIKNVIDTLSFWNKTFFFDFALD